MKKVISVLISFVLMMTMLVPAFADNEYDVVVTADEVKSISAVAQKPLIKGFDSQENSYVDENGNEVVYDFYDVYAAEPIFTITLKNGDVYTGTDQEIFEQTGEYTYEVIDQAEDPLVIGKNEVVFSYYDAECVCEIELIENPYKSLKLSGENEIVLTFEGKKAEDTKTVLIVDAFVWYMDDNKIDLQLIDENGKAYEAYYFCKTEDEMLYINENVSIQIAGMRSNEVPVNNWLDARMAAELVVDAAVSLWSVDDFENYRSDSEEFNADQLLQLAAFIAYPDYEYVDENRVSYVIDAITAEAMVKAIFDREVNSSESDMYNSEDRTLVMEQVFGLYYYENLSLVYADGAWTMKAEIYDMETDEKVARLFVVLSAEGKVEQIRFATPEQLKGDMNDDGEVASVDARFILQYVANLRTMTEEQLEVADLDGSGVVDIVDARWALQVAAGLRKI